MPDLESVALANYRACRAALALIREVVEELAPPGSVPYRDCVISNFQSEIVDCLVGD